MPISKSELRKRAHTGKKKYPTQAAADAAIVGCKQPWAKGLETYKCPFGPHWHVGHNKKSKQSMSTETPSAHQSGSISIREPDEAEKGAS
jgi:hypothetical protein